MMNMLFDAGALLFFLAILLPLAAFAAWIVWAVKACGARKVFGTKSRARRKANARGWLIAAILLTAGSIGFWVLLLLMFGDNPSVPL